MFRVFKWLIQILDKYCVNGHQFEILTGTVTFKIKLEMTLYNSIRLSTQLLVGYILSSISPLRFECNNILTGTTWFKIKQQMIVFAIYFLNFNRHFG